MSNLLPPIKQKRDISKAMDDFAADVGRLIGTAFLMVAAAAVIYVGYVVLMFIVGLL